MGMITFFFLMIYSKKLETNWKMKFKVDFLARIDSGCVWKVIILFIIIIIIYIVIVNYIVFILE